MFKKSFFLLFLLSLFFSCSHNEYTKLKVLTDQKDMIIVSELYNKSQDKVRISLIYDNYISKEDLEREKIDLVIGRDLNNPNLCELFTVMEPSDGIYSVLLDGVILPGTLLPLAFDLPALIYSRDKENIPLILDATTLQQLGPPLNKRTDSQLSHMGFSPLWSDEFLFWFLQGEGITFYKETLFDYDHQLLEDKLENIHSWVNENSGSLADEESFSAKYRYIPDYKLLKTGYLDFSAMLFSHFTALPEAETVGLTHSWYGDGEKIHPQGVVFGALLLESGEQELGRVFLNWLTNPQVIEQLIILKGNVTPGFALFDGFSSIEEINRLILPDYFPKNLKDRIFLPEQLAPPVGEPKNWSAIRENVINPWLHERVRKTSSLPLSSYYNEWQLLFID